MGFPFLTTLHHDCYFSHPLWDFKVIYEFCQFHIFFVDFWGLLQSKTLVQAAEMDVYIVKRKKKMEAE